MNVFIVKTFELFFLIIINSLKFSVMHFLLDIILNRFFVFKENKICSSNILLIYCSFCGNSMISVVMDVKPDLCRDDNTNVIQCCHVGL